MNGRRPRLERISGALRSFAIGFGLLLGTAILLKSVYRHYPIEHWLFWRYASYWLAALGFSVSTAAFGHRLLRLVNGRPLPWLEQLAVSQALGVFAFQLALFGLGVLQLYDPVTFFALPAAFLAFGGRSFWRSVAHAYRHFRSPVLLPKKLSIVGWIAILFGSVCLVALYLPVMSPQNSSFDARWRHLYIAEQYVVHGGIRPFAEGWSLGASPHFTSLLYTWGFMFPGGQLFDRVELCAHLEYAIFLWTTLVGIPALVRRLVPRANPATTWAARFLFPGTFLYDSNLSVGADHIGALFAPALLLCCLRMWRTPSPRQGALLGAFIAAAVCAKETTALLLAPFAILLVIVRFALDLARWVVQRRSASGAPWLGSVIAGAATLVLTMPHWLKNLLWYGDPLYPNLHRTFAARPWGPNAAYSFEYGFKTMLWAPQHDLQGLKQALQTLFTFSFKPFSWWTMHRDVPVLGSLFTLMLLVLPFVRGARRIWLLVACVHVSVFAWFWVHHEERHLQALVPWMAAGFAATASLLWRGDGGRTRVRVPSWPTRTLLVLLIGAQAVWGSDVLFFPTHSMTGGSALRAPVELLGRGYLGDYFQRLEFMAEHVRVGALVPPAASLLVHERRDHLGFRRKTVTDIDGDQFGIDYLTLLTPEAIHGRYSALGITHVAWVDSVSDGIAPLAADIAFFDFAHRYTSDRRRSGVYYLANLPKSPPQPTAARRAAQVAVIGCGHDYQTGIYPLSDLTTPRFGPSRSAFVPPRRPIPPDDTSWRDGVFAVALETPCLSPISINLIQRDFERVARRGERWGPGHEIWLRREPDPLAPLLQ